MRSKLCFILNVEAEIQNLQCCLKGRGGQPLESINLRCKRGFTSWNYQLTILLTFLSLHFIDFTDPDVHANQV